SVSDVCVDQIAHGFVAAGAGCWGAKIARHLVLRWRLGAKDTQRKNARNTFLRLLRTFLRGMVCAMNDFLTAVELERRARPAGLTIKEMCSRAGVHPASFTRWKAGLNEPNMARYKRMVSVVEAATQD